jgi:diguanylate cyclase (GGDEF)-like protein
VPASSAAPLARLDEAREELAKQWLQGIIDRTPLAEVGALPVEWLAREAPAVVGEIVREVASPAAIAEPGGGAAARLAELARVRTPPAAIHRDLASLHSLLVGALSREVRDRGALASATERLAEAIGAIQTTLGEAMVEPAGGSVTAEAPPRVGEIGRDPVTGLSSAGELHDCLGRLLAGHKRYGHPFAVMSIDIEGLGRMNTAYGPDAGDRMLEAVAATITREIRTVDYVFRVGDDDFCVLAPFNRAVQVRPLGERLRRSLDGEDADEGPWVSLAIGIASCPEHGESAVALLDAAREATYAAKAGGQGIAIANGADAGPGEARVPLA